MELKTARLTLLIDPIKKAAFERLCASQDRTASQVVRQLIRNYLVEHGADDISPGVEPPPTDASEATLRSPGAHKVGRSANKSGKPVPEPASRSGPRRR